MTSISVADWLQGWGTVAGSIFSAIAAVTALALYWRESSNRGKDLNELFAHQARNILVTIDTPNYPNKLRNVKVVCSNFSDEVVTSLYARIHRLDTGTEVTFLSSDVYGPKRVWTFRVKLNPVMICNRPEHPPDLFIFNYWFTDSRGQHWRRVDRRPPERIDNTPYEEWEKYEFQPR